MLVDLDYLIHILYLNESTHVIPLTPAETDPVWFHHHISRIDPKAIATLIFSPGLNGLMSVTEISHQTICTQVLSSQLSFDRGTGSRTLVCLPYSVWLMRLALYRRFLKANDIVFTPVSLLTVAFDRFRPTELVISSDDVEYQLDNLISTISTRSTFKQAIVHWALAVSNSTEKRRIRWQRPLANRLVLAPIFARMGGAIQTIVVLGNGLQPSTRSLLHALDISLVTDNELIVHQ